VSWLWRSNSSPPRESPRDSLVSTSAFRLFTCLRGSWSSAARRRSILSSSLLHLAGTANWSGHPPDQARVMSTCADNGHPCATAPTCQGAQNGREVSLRILRCERKIIPGLAVLNDAAIRAAIHRQRLRGMREHAETLVVDELGIDHGKLRADIAVVNGRLTGFEIKSDLDSLARLRRQITGYRRVFDYAHVVATDRHLKRVRSMVPGWWGIVAVSTGPRGGLRFRTVRRGSQNPKRSAIALARLLWRDEIVALLSSLGMHGKSLRRERSRLYRSLVRRVTTDDVARLVRGCLRSRAGWRDLSRPSLYGDSSQRIAKS
jgi:hypothetical protein